MSEIFTIDELLSLNDMMLGRGKPMQDDGVGYNKADYGVCSNYFFGVSDAQVADLAKRLVKYSVTQLNIDKQLMQETSEYYRNLLTDDDSRVEGVSVNITREGTLISFRYNESFINVVRKQPNRIYDRERKQWIVPTCNAIKVLKELECVGADTKNAIKYFNNHLMNNSKGIEYNE